ncbi:MAG: hypothetical protein LBT74_05745 [Acidobacteriota bacterium]|jgi:type II secretory pathway pseudopilin PulG|nr:hypothetical protein [Acidobacteriota bacterium]
MDGSGGKPPGRAAGFGLIELVLALLLLGVGLLAAGPLLGTTARLTAQARSRSAAALAAQDALERLSDLCRRNPSAAELSPGDHREDALLEVRNPLEGNVLDRYQVSWSVGAIPDPRPGVTLPGKAVAVRVTTALPGGDLAEDRAVTVNMVTGCAPGAASEVAP